MTYAEGTSVSVEKSKFELDSLLRKHGAGQRVFGDDDVNGKAYVIFSLKERQYRLEVPLPKIEEFAKKKQRSWMIACSEEEKRRRHEQACRERWRAVVLVAMGVSSVEREFLADLLLPNGARMHVALAEQIEKTYLDGSMPPLLGMGGE